jgi:phosphoribosylformimino-5-aminoimidazole carboxamide ribotide isomerase
MLLIPAIDLRAGRVVRLHQGDFEKERTYSTDPLAVARQYAEAGAKRLHIVDLDAARGRGSDNRETVEQITQHAAIDIQLGGGVRTEADVQRWIGAGATAVVMGTTAIRHPELLAEIATRHDGQVFAALDVRGGQPAVTGWSHVESLTMAQVLTSWEGAPLAGVILTSIDRDGTMSGPDLRALTEAKTSTQHRLTYSGGIARVEDLMQIEKAGANGAILGRSLLEGRFTLRQVLNLFS